MHTETITIERVFDVQRRRASRYAPRRTDFSFEANGVKRYAVQVPGWPSLDAGSRLTVVLGSAGNWQSLAGWMNHSTGEVVLPEFRRSLSRAWQSLLVSVLTGAAYTGATTSVGRVAAAAMSAFLLLVALNHFVEYRRKKALANAILQANAALQPTTVARG
jgi:hypothetical protein